MNGLWETKKGLLKVALVAIGWGCMAVPVMAQAPAAPKEANIVVIMGDDVGMWNIGGYSRGMMADDYLISIRLRSRGCCSRTITPRRAVRRAIRTSSPANCQSARE